MIIAVIPLLVAIIGLLIYLLASDVKFVEIGKIMFFCGLLALMFSSAEKTVRIGSASAANYSRLV